MTVLVTGASGMLGREVALELLRAGHRVRVLQRGAAGLDGVEEVRGSITDAAAVDRAMQGVDAVVHLAAKVSLAGDPTEFEQVNVGGTEVVLDAAETAGVSRFVHISSPSVAHGGSALVGVGAEPADPGAARGEYARTKAQGELLALERDRRGFAVVVVRPHLVWGPGDPQLVERIVDRARRGRLPLLDDGTALIDSTYVANAASAVAAAHEHAETAHGRAFVVTNGEPRPVGELLAGICRAAGVEPPSFSVPAGIARAAGGLVERLWSIRPGADEPPMTRFLAEQLSTAHWFDQRDTREALHWTPAVSIDEGLERLAAHYRA
ncbi:NAD(P)-dependent oxidoreductase [Plantibacter sp. Leaf314]|uniref:NAD-dependent epimerase/dehydratase family protein n=1 Tax=Plantibacter sp. Leaf314 TaxID=1736333 RepID=UPI0006F808F1|nr:NAD-dependent epimerase/dehydratase family protein [Plantibacter sp. Leaf314]KQQ53378.1 nucleoside-diphosphate sugar epimerase [Plantibacter sp. Leaf314]